MFLIKCFTSKLNFIYVLGPFLTAEYICLVLNIALTIWNYMIQGHDEFKPREFEKNRICSLELNVKCNSENHIQQSFQI